MFQGPNPVQWFPTAVPQNTCAQWTLHKFSAKKEDFSHLLRQTYITLILVFLKIFYFQSQVFRNFEKVGNHWPTLTYHRISYPKLN